MLFYTLTVLNGIVVFFALLTYSMIFMTLRHRKRTFHGQTSSVNQHCHQKAITIPMLIIVSFIIFYSLPVMILTIMQMETLHHLIQILFALGYICDPAIYVFLVKKHRTTIIGLFTPRKHVTNRNAANQRPVYFCSMV